MEKKQKINKKLSDIIEKKVEPKKEAKIEMVEGVIKNLEMKGVPIEFTYSRKGKSPAERYCLKDGDLVKIPKDVARHLNKCSYETSQAELDSKGNFLRSVKTIVNRFSFRQIDDLYDGIG